METTFATLAAEIYKWPSKPELVQIFKSHNYRVTEGRHSVRLDDYDHFVFRELGGELGSGCISADHKSTQELIIISGHVSQTLAQADVRHRFEVYSEEAKLAAYIHHDWPH